VAAKASSLVKADSCVCALNWDDILSTATSCTLDNTEGVTEVTFFITISGTTQFKVVAPKQTAVLTFATPLVVLNVGGAAVISNMQSIGAGVQVDVGKF